MTLDEAPNIVAMNKWLEGQGKAWSDVLAYFVYDFERWVQDATTSEILAALADGPMSIPDLDRVLNYIADMTEEELKQHQEYLIEFWLDKARKA